MSSSSQVSLAPTVRHLNRVAGGTGEGGEVVAVNGVWAVTAPGSYMYIVCLTLLASFFLPSHLSFKNMYIHIGGAAAVNRDGWVIHRKRSGGGSYSQL